jgi:subtilisin family serine protease
MVITAVPGHASRPSLDAANAGRAPDPRPASLSKFAPLLSNRVIAAPQAPVIAWVYFTDRAGDERDPAGYAAIHGLLSARSLERRERRGSVRGVLVSDLPVHESYVRALTVRGARLRGTSRWLNAASVEMSGTLAIELSHLPFVARVELVPVGMPISPVDEPVTAEVTTSVPARPAAPATAAVTTLAPGDTAYYGGTFKQLAMMQVPQLHKAGLSGAGVLVCMLDDGFRLTHQVFTNLHVVATRDFIHGDTNVDYQAAQDSVPGNPNSGQGFHGTMTLACVAGSRPGTYSGGAFGASVALAKTEFDPTERPVEMDYWQFGAEWADSLGADVISSSLGYSVFDSGYTSYTLADMNGRTTVVARAAVEAARRGITVVNAAGNEGANSWKKIISPGDADSIVTSGAVDSFNVVTGFSSRGPTADGRIKPDVTAMGSSVLAPLFNNLTAYQRVSGTSFSTPLTAGVVALLLESHPNWGPFEVREALRMTALNHASPDTIIGWGLVQASAANAWIPSTIGVPQPVATGTLALAASPNPLRAGRELAVRFSAPAGESVRLDVLDLAGRRQARLYDGMAPSTGSVSWRGHDHAGAMLPAGIYWVRLQSRDGSSRSVRVALIP